MAMPRILRRTGAAALVAAACGLAAPAAGGILSGFKNSLISFALEQISVPDTLEIQAEEIQDPEEGFVRLVGVTIADKNGVWMKIGELVVDWDVSRILRAELEINTLVATDVDWIRTPNREDVEVEVKEGSELDRSLGGIFDWPRSPIDTRIDEMRLDDVFIEAGVLASQSIRFDAAGAARDEGDEQFVSLEVTRTDNVEGLIDFEYLRTFDANTLKLQLEAREAAGGIVAAMAGFPNDAASRMSIDANGPLSEWGMVFEAETETVFEARGNALLSTSEPFTISADFSLTPGENMEPRLRRVLSPEATLTLEVAEDEDGTIRIEEATIASPEVNLTASGGYSRATSAVDLDVVLAVEAGLAETIEGVSLGRFTFEGNVGGTADDMTATGALDLDGLETTVFAVEDATLEAVVSVTGARVGAEIDGRVDGVRLDRLKPEQIGTAEIGGQIVYENEVVRLDGLTLASPLLELGASGALDLAASTAELNYRLASSRIGEIAQAYDVDATGAMRVEGQLAGPLDAPRLTGDAAFTELTYAGDEYGQVTITHDIELGEELQGKVDLAASGSPYGPAKIDTAFIVTAERELRLTEMAATALGVTAEGRATVHLDDRLVAGAVDILAEDLSEAGDYLNVPIGGGADGRVELTIDQGRQMVDAELNLNGFRGPGVVIGGGRLALDVDDALGTPRLEATLDGRALTIQGIEIASVDGSFVPREGEEIADVEVNLLTIEGDGFVVPSARVEGTVTDPFGEVALDLDLSAGSVEGEEISADGITGAVAATPGLARVDIDLIAERLRAMGAAAGRAVIDATVEDALSEARIRADLKLDELTYEDIRLGRFAGRVETTAALESLRLDAELTGVEGEGLKVRTATVDGVVEDPLGQPKIDADLEIAGLVYLEDRIGGLTGRIDTTEEGDLVVLDVVATDFSVAGAAGDRAVLDGSIRDPFSDLPKVDAELAIDGLVYQDVRLGRLAGTVDSSEDGREVAFDLGLSGVEGDGLTVNAAEVSGTVTDPLGQPAVDADLTVRDLAFRDVTLEELTGQVRTTPEKDLITLDATLRALDGQGVRIERAEIDGEVADPFDEPKPTGELLVEGLAYGGDPIGTVRGTVETVEAEGAPARIEVDVRLEGEGEGTGAARAVIDATVRDPYGQPLVDAVVDIAELRFGDVLRIERMDGTVETTGSGDAVDVDLDLAGIEGAGVVVDAATVDGTVTDPFGDPAVRADIAAERVLYGEEVRIDNLDAQLLSLDGLRRIDVDAEAAGFAGFGVRFETAAIDGVLLDPMSEPGFDGEISATSFAYQDDLSIGQIAGTVYAEPGLAAVELDVGFRELRGYGASAGAGHINGVLTDPTGEPGFSGEVGIEALAYGDDVAIGRLSGVVSAEPGLGSVDLDVNVDDLDAYGARAASADVTGVVTDPTGDVRFDGKVSARQVRYGDYRVGRFSADVDATEGGDRIDVRASVSSVDGGGAKLVSADLKAVVENALSEPVIRAELSARDAGFQGNDVSRLQAEAVITGVTGGSPSIEGRATMAGVRAAGARIDAFDLTYDLEDVAGTPTGAIDGTASGLTIGGITARRGDVAARLTEAGGRTRLVADLDLSTVDIGLATVDSLTVDATVDDALGASPVLSVRAESSAADLGFARLTGGLFSADGPLSGLNLALSTTGDRVLYGETTVPLSFEATARLDARQGLLGQLSTAVLTIGEDRIALDSPLRLSGAGGATRLSEINLAIPGGSVRGDLAVYPSGLVGDLLVEITDPKPIGRLAQLPQASGMVRVAADFDTRPGSARADVDLDASDLRFEDVYGDFGALGLDLDLDWDGRTANVALDISGPFAEPVRGRLMLPLRPTGGLIPSVPQNASVDGSLTWQGDVGTIWPLVPLTDHVLDGPLDVDLRVTGPIGGPQVSGQIRMTGGRYENLEFGTILTDVNITSEVRSTEDFTLNVTATDAASSTITGRVSIGPAGLDAEVRARDAILVRRDDVTAMLSLDVTATGPLNAPRIAGDINIDRAEVRLVNLTPPTVATLGEVRIKGQRPPPPRTSAGAAITLDLNVEAPDDIYIRGRGLDSEWRASLAIGGTASDPRITGEIERIRGQLSLLGRKFDLDEGSIDFNGSAPIDPRLNVRLVRDSDDITGGIWVHGTARDVEVEFFSTPALPEDEVLPRVLFGRSKQSLSAIEAVQLAAGVATLLDGTGGALDNIRSSLGVDVFRVDSEGESASVTVGRNVADDVFVGVKQPVGGGQASVQVEIEVFDNFQVESEVGGQKGSSVGLQWKKDF